MAAFELCTCKPSRDHFLCFTQLCSLRPLANTVTVGFSAGNTSLWSVTVSLVSAESAGCLAGFHEDGGPCRCTRSVCRRMTAVFPALSLHGPGMFHACCQESPPLPSHGLPLAHLVAGCLPFASDLEELCLHWTASLADLKLAPPLEAGSSFIGCKSSM